MAPYASFGTMEQNVSNAQIVINLGMSSGERAIYTLVSRLMGVIFNKQGEIHHAVINKIICDNKFDGKTITDAAMLSGFDSPSHFAATTKRMMGIAASLSQLHPEW